MMIFDKVENIWQKKKMLVSSNFSYPKMFSKGGLLKVIKSLTSTLKELADNFKFDENGRKFSQRIENTGKRRN